MDRQRRQPGSTDRLTTFAKGSKAHLGDAGSQQLVKLGKLIGNDQALAMVSRANTQRDAMLSFIRQRLSTIKNVQQLELQEMKDRPDWWRLVGQGKAGFKLPDPTRWRKPAELYRKAAEAACSGNLGRANDLVKQGVEAERLAFQSLPKQVQVPSQLQAPAGAPDESAFIEDGAGCTATSAPDIMGDADRIIAQSEHLDNVSTPWVQKNHHWWEVEESDDPDKKDKKGKKSGGEGVKGAGVRDPEKERLEDRYRSKDTQKEAQAQEQVQAQEQAQEQTQELVQNHDQDEDIHKEKK